MVDIHLNIPGSRDPFISIPNSDVRRLSKRPFKWLRFVMFCICGARGDLSATPDGPPVDYDSTSFSDVYYYNPSGSCIFVDYAGLNDRITSTSQTRRRSGFRDDVKERDGGVCIITQQDGCDAAHLIPHSKRDEYMDRVVNDRSPLYRSSPSISGINDVQNGVFLRKDLHWRLGRGLVAFIKTPNYGLELDDIRRFPDNSAGTDQFTLQQLKPDRNDPAMLESLTNSGVSLPGIAFEVGANLNARLQGGPIPPAIILDYVYGVATYKCWGREVDGDDAVMKRYHREHYTDIPRPPSDHNNHGNHDDSSSFEETDDPKDPTHPSSGSRPRKHHISLRNGDEMARAMDKVNMVLMSLHGITPQEAANRREKRMMVEEMRAQEASRNKVMEWMNTTDSVDSEERS